MADNLSGKSLFHLHQDEIEIYENPSDKIDDFLIKLSFLSKWLWHLKMAHLRDYEKIDKFQIFFISLV